MRSYKVRKLQAQSQIDYFGITVPREIAKEFSGIDLFVEQRGNSIVFTSGNKNMISAGAWNYG